MVALAASPSDGGTVTGGGFKTVGATVTVKAKANAGWKFTGWADGVAPASRRVVVPGNGTNLTAGFALATGVLVFDRSVVAVGEVPVTQVGTQLVTVSNTGTGVVKVTGMTLPATFTAQPARFTLAGGASQVVVVSFKPSAVGAVGGALVIKSDAARVIGAPTISGTGIPQTFVVRLGGDMDFGEICTTQTVSRVLTVHNDGNSPLNVTQAVWTNNDRSFSVVPTRFTVPAGGAAPMTVTFAPRMAQRYDSTVLVLTLQKVTGGTRGIAVRGGATANVAGTWNGSLSTSQGSASGTVYAWQDGDRVVATVTAYGMEGILVGQVTNRSVLDVNLWTNRIYAGRATLRYASGPKLTGSAANGGVTVNLSRKSLTVPVTATKPDVDSLPAPAARPAVSSADMPVATVRVLAPPDGGGVAAVDGVCATLDRLLRVTFPQPDPAGAPWVLVRIEEGGAGGTLAGRVDDLLPDTAPLLVLRLRQGVLTLESTCPERVRVEGEPVASDKLPGAWRVILAW